MRLICPNCVAQYEVDDSIIPPEGRDVQCANCGHNWFQDSVQMLSVEAETPSGTGDPDSDVPPELFNDLEGKLEPTFTSTRAPVAPDPNDMEPESPRDEFQIEQQPDAPPTRLDKDALDILHAEAEYSSGKKPPATADEAETDKPDVAVKDIAESVAPAQPEQPVVQHDNAPSEPVKETLSSAPLEPVFPPADTASPAADDLDEIRRRIMDLETEEDHHDKPEEPPLSEMDEDLTTSAPATDDTNVPPKHQKNIPIEREIFETPDQNEPVAQSIDSFVEQQETAETIPEVIAEKPRRKVTPRQFPNIGEISDELYGTSKEHAAARKDMLPDVDILSSEIATEAEQGGVASKTANTPPAKSGSGFLTGFKYAILLCILIAIVYTLQPQIIEYIPQSAGAIKALNGFVDTLGAQLGPLLDVIKEFTKS